MELQSPSHGDEFESACSTPFASAPSSPGRGGSSSAVAGFFFFSAPSSPMHYVLSSATSPCSPEDSPFDPASGEFSFEFEFSSRVHPNSTAASADELFLNGQIRPMKLSSHLQRPQSLAPLPDLGAEEDENAEDDARGSREAMDIEVRGRDLKLRSRSVHRRARSMSPLRNLQFRWWQHGKGREEWGEEREKTPDPKQIEAEEVPAPPVSASSRSSSSSSTSSSSSSGRISKQWISLKDFLHRSKSEAGGQGKKFWNGISFSSSKAREKPMALSEPETNPQPTTSTSKREEGRQLPPSQQRPMNGTGRRRRTVPSAHERLYTANRAQAEEMRRRTFLPYRQDLLGCLWFSSRSYGAINSFARSLNSVSSR
ncbi:uncharacterized protein LOC141820190 [Curcuma longa]|uniref:uncharacterized protein LOC141820190 n=1 Tax=Curcuma longa TaxID=136217 RepID=UPI003D9F363E